MTASRRLLAALAAATTLVASAATLTAVTTTVAVVSAPAPAYALDNGMARTPPMGFNNWNTTHCRADFNEAMIKGIADIFVSRGLKAAGYEYVNIDDCWAKPQRDANGNLVPDPVRFPNGIKALADYVHSKGLKFGIYTSAGTKTCNTAGFPGALGHEYQDARLFASWGVDYLKYDNCNNQGVDAIQRYTKMRDALAATGRPIVYSICEWGRSDPKVWTWGKNVGNLWRTTGDISDNWTSMIGKAQFNRNLPQYAGPGHWNDPDMLEVGNGGMTATEYRTHFSLWAMMAAPLLIGSDLRKVNEDTFTILKNTDVIAVDQDPLGRQATVISNSSGRVVYSKVLANGDRAVALSNETTTTATIGTSAAAIGLGGSASYTLKDLWTKSSRTTTGSISASVPPHGTVMYRVSRAGTATRYEAEKATISQGTVDSDHSGFSGEGFVNYTNVTGSYVEWTVTAAEDGPATLVFDYANGTTTNRPMDIRVNGALAAAQQAFPDTGAWSLWKTAIARANLRAGPNTIRATATTSNGGPNVDHLDVVVGEGEPSPTSRYEAEDGVCDGTVDSDHAGFSGTGFCNTTNVTGSYVEWTVTAASAGTYRLTFRFANGTTANRPMGLTVNGAGAGAVDFPGTGAWTSWQTVTTTVTLAAGTHRPV
ncbi:MAG: CBM35 domain-containing protein, partial [Micromonosporaceae bacterium]